MITWRWITRSLGTGQRWGSGTGHRRPQGYPLSPRDRGGGGVSLITWGGGSLSPPSPHSPPGQPGDIFGQLLASGTGRRRNLRTGRGWLRGTGTGKRGVPPPAVCPPPRSPRECSVSGCRTMRTYWRSPNCSSSSPSASSSVSNDRFLGGGGGNNEELRGPPLPEAPPSGGGGPGPLPRDPALTG